MESEDDGLVDGDAGERANVVRDWNNSSKEPGTGSLEASISMSANSQ